MQRADGHAQNGRSFRQFFGDADGITDKEALKKTMPQIEKPDDLQLIANFIRFLRMHGNFGSILNGVDDDFSTPFFVFTKYLRNDIK